MTENRIGGADYQLSVNEKDALGEIGNICMGTCATTLSTLLGKRVTITTPKVSLCHKDSVFDEYEKPTVVAEVAYTEGVEGNNIFILKKEDALLITDLLMGNDGTSPEEELKEYYLSAMSEVMNQMVGSSATALANILQAHINISPPEVNEVSRDDDFSGVNFKDDTFIKIGFRMEIEDMLVSSIMNLMSYNFGRDLAYLLTNEGNEEAPAGSGKTQQNKDEILPNERKTDAVEKERTVAENQNVDIRTAKYQSFDHTNVPSNAQKHEDSNSNMDLLMDVPMQVTVVLGKCKKSIEEILNLNMGSVVVLDRLAGEMVDVHVNGKLFARGEVVVIDDYYGVRITELSADKKEYNDMRSGNLISTDIV